MKTRVFLKYFVRGCTSLPFGHIMHINKNKNLVFAELNNIGEIKYIFDKFYEKLKGLTFYSKWVQKVQTFR